ncbi:molybdate ABC transporter substrate-binding protein [Sporosarcina sp. NCCP-2716]|uniref:molybdate ABC transporter substrate-binding protein n=1 Tax=Sporosarcina sp. NCCP-2716 TaxID=2943679 RepID=UPI00203DFB14|nr:molybdate ABC transporter substrate-binding protein [Sporosarcina sp. NCCP-2716]GKV68222.1 molybdate ABC transporter substrate-binding protein [Sporosarcina sp. NCCP-2716]
MRQAGKLVSTMAAAFLLLAGCSGGTTTEKDNEAADSSKGKIELHISAAASLTDALDEYKKAYEKEHEDVKLTFMYGGSGKLAAMIDNGAPADLFLSASAKDMDTLEDKGLIDDSTRTDFTKNALVLIAGADEQDTVSSFEQIDPSAIDHLVIGEPESVPAGRYTKEVFEHLNLWQTLQDKLVLASDVRQVLTQVEMGNAEYGVVYSSDAFISDKVKTVAEADPDWHAPIVYPGAVLANAEHPEEAQQFFDALLGEDGQAVLAEYGFK